MEDSNKLIQERIQRAKELLKVRHASMATVNEDGSPHNSPYRFMYSPDLTKLYWGSHPGSLHSQNILRTGQLFVAVYDAYERGGLYIKASNGHIADGGELTEALAVHNKLRTENNETPIERSYYEGDGPQRMWVADITELSINYSEKNEQGLLVQDLRREITANDLLT